MKCINRLAAFDDVITNTLSNKELNPIVTELFIRDRELSISIVLITQSYFAAPRNIRLISTDYIIMKILRKQELEQIAFNHWSDIEFKNKLSYD